MFVVDDEILFEMDEYIKHSYKAVIKPYKSLVVEKCPINRIKNTYVRNKYSKPFDLPEKVIVGF